ncbi:undecaprenyl-diphosphate phosphatase [Ignavigranum ruoffiae]|uniref:Undecaprenyl-diphosphatase n=1 Tax=Ignavigranum ruoffiae TaxID=89093 RepID=A0A1H9E2V2_9LACT|nr:undecaprenyl-diphosphate phosphatase [Ignavigranum ruoffiae]UPQ85287.1 undecaprenyl-diphosphate phosphatase [Ignavigranum ruoffiae]SEQ19278.1 Undecaprenyl-diphosphatase [Ignavigranum ruoffiae]
MENIDILELIKIIILSVVQGITEWLPISSTGHMIVIEDFMPLSLSSNFRELFLVLVQLGSIIAVLVLYFQKLNPFSLSKDPGERKQTWILWLKVAFASLPAVLFGFVLDDYMDEYFYNPVVVAIALIVYGIGFIWIESHKQGKHAFQIQTLADLSFATAFKIGLFQALAIIPGTSRSGSTIIGALILGASRFVATEFSFFMSVPIMFGASLMKLVKLGFGLTSLEYVYLGIGMVIAFIVSILAIKFLLSYIKRHDFKAFGYYRIILGALILLYFVLK